MKFKDGFLHFIYDINRKITHTGTFSTVKYRQVTSNYKYKCYKLRYFRHFVDRSKNFEKIMS